MTRAMAFLAVLAFLWPVHAYADEDLLRLLRGGGQVLFIRHASTVPGAGDPAGFRLEDCATQRNLSAEGREEAQRLGRFIAAEGIEVARVISSPWCRCLDTARLAFGRVDERWSALSNLFGRGQLADAQVRELKPRIGLWNGRGNLVFVSHGSVASALAGIHPAQGEIIVLTPRGVEGFGVAGRLSPPR
jgi:phosphohistidine phosphatase SixA